MCQIWCEYIQHLWRCDHSNNWVFLAIQQAQVLLNFLVSVYMYFDLHVVNSQTNFNTICCSQFKLNGDIESSDSVTDKRFLLVIIYWYWREQNGKVNWPRHQSINPSNDMRYDLTSLYIHVMDILHCVTCQHLNQYPDPQQLQWEFINIFPL